MSKIYTVPELQSVLSPIFRANGVRKATLFGSYAKGVATASSDVDLLVDSGLRGLAFFGLLEQVTEALDAPVDLIDVSQVETGSEIAREIQKSGVALFEQQRSARSEKDPAAHRVHSALLPGCPQFSAVPERLYVGGGDGI